MGEGDVLDGVCLKGMKIGCSSGRISRNRERDLGDGRAWGGGVMGEAVDDREVDGRMLRALGFKGYGDILFELALAVGRGGGEAECRRSEDGGG
ncbi:unnamed protein product [Linum trigynum]|uniref:Uncharacterized protein n=1 Tax=Linum trigynum TaxID=586398 RepID=A0AAV2GN05_9ROSI